MIILDGLPTVPGTGSLVLTPSTVANISIEFELSR